MKKTRKPYLILQIETSGKCYHLWGKLADAARFLKTDKDAAYRTKYCNIQKALSGLIATAYDSIWIRYEYEGSIQQEDIQRLVANVQVMQAIRSIDFSKIAAKQMEIVESALRKADLLPAK